MLKAPPPTPVTTESTPVAIQHVRWPSLKVKHNEAIATKAQVSILPKLSEDLDDLKVDDLEVDDLEEDDSNESPLPQLPSMIKETQALIDEYLSANAVTDPDLGHVPVSCTRLSPIYSRIANKVQPYSCAFWPVWPSGKSYLYHSLGALVRARHKH
jgi:hypothetical protein